MDTVDATRQLASFVVESRWDAVPGDVRQEARRAILNWLGCALGGSREAIVDTALAALGEVAGPPQATLLGRGGRVDILNAAFMNAIASNALDFDDTHIPTLIHPTVTVASAAFAVAEHAGSSGADFLHAYLLGVETACRIGNAVSPDHHASGWEITATCGVFGAAAACGRLMQLDERQMKWALGIAATQAAGLTSGLGTMTKCFNMGRAAQAGVMAALLASKHFTSAERALEGPRGFLQVIGRSRDIDSVGANLGARWEVSRLAYKPYPCGVVIHPVIDACLDLRADRRIAPESIDRIDIRVAPVVAQVTGNAAPAGGIEAKPSMPHCAAAALAYGEVGGAQFTKTCVRDSLVSALRSRVRLHGDASMPHGSAEVAITLEGGEMLRKRVEHARGSLERPLGDGDLERKFRALAASRLAPSEIEALIAHCRSLSALPDVAALARASHVDGKADDGRITPPEKRMG